MNQKSADLQVTGTTSEFNTDNHPIWGQEPANAEAAVNEQIQCLLNQGQTFLYMEHLFRRVCSEIKLTSWTFNVRAAQLKSANFVGVEDVLRIIPLDARVHFLKIYLQWMNSEE